MAVSLVLAYKVNSQNVANNTSNVTVHVSVQWTYGSYNKNAKSGWLSIDGTTYNFTSSFNTGETTSGTQTIFSKTVNVPHNSDGTKTLECAASYTTGVSSGTIAASFKRELTTIPRKSSLTASNGTLGTKQTLTVERESSGFTHTITYKCGDASGTIVTKSSDTSIEWTPPLSLAQENTTGTSVSVTLTITTYNGSTSVGSNTKTITCSIPSSVKPSVSVAVSDPMGYATTYGAYVQGLSKLKIVATASGSQGSTIKSYKTEADGKTYTEATVTSGVIAGTGTLTIKVTVTDSRGRTATASTTVSVLAYDFPKISALAVYRSDANGNASSSGAYLAVKFSSVITSLNNKNTAAYTLQYKKSSATSYTTKTLSDFAGKYSVSNGVYVFSADTASSYDIILTVKDAFKSIPKTATGSSVKKVWSLLKKAGEIVGFAFGKIAELEGVFDVDFVIRARKGIIVDAEWVDLTLDDDFAVYNGTVANQPKYKVTGNVVTVMGVVSPKAEFTSSTTAVTIASGIPAELRPSINLQFLCQGSGMNHWCCSINTNGTVGLARYGTTEATTVPATAWLTFTVTYQI